MPNRGELPIAAMRERNIMHKQFLARARGNADSDAWTVG